MAEHDSGDASDVARGEDAAEQSEPTAKDPPSGTRPAGDTATVRDEASEAGTVRDEPSEAEAVSAADADAELAPGSDDGTEHAEGHPRGTMLLMLLYLIAIVAMWGYIYMLLISRGG